MIKTSAKKNRRQKEGRKKIMPKNDKFCYIITRMSELSPHVAALSFVCIITIAGILNWHQAQKTSSSSSFIEKGSVFKGSLNVAWSIPIKIRNLIKEIQLRTFHNKIYIVARLVMGSARQPPSSPQTQTPASLKKTNINVVLATKVVLMIYIH